ncbi:MAG TPA: tetratricopeptide repeat protein [Microvirga sp.]
MRRPVLTRLVAGLILAFAALLPLAASAQSVDDLAVGARAAAGAANHAEAVRLFDQAIRTAPERRAEWLLEYADQLAFAGRPGEAVPLYRERLGDRALPASDRRRAERGLAFALLWSSQFDEAIAAFQQIAGQDPADAEARRAVVDAVVGAARSAAERGANPEAVQGFERVIALDPARRPEIAREYADQLAYAGRPQQAVPIYREVLARPNLAPEERRRATRGLAFALLWSSAFDAAIPAWDAILRESPGDEEARRTLSEAQVGAGRQAASSNRNGPAAAFFRQAIETAPARRAELLPEYADQLAFAGRPAEAVPLYREALQNQRSPQDQQRLRRGLAFALFWSGAYRESLPALEAVLAASPGDADAQRAIADARTRITGGGPAAASGAPAPQAAAPQTPPAQPAAPVQPASPADAAIAAARAAAGRGANKEAAAAFERAFALDPARRRTLAREYADQLAYAGEPARAVPVYREVLQQAGLPAEERRTTTRNLAFALLWSSQWPEAIAAWQTIVEQNPRDGEALKARSDALVGAARQAAGRNANGEAASLFARAISGLPDRRGELLPEYADQVAYAGRPAEAVPLYREALRDGARPAAERTRLRRGLAFALLWSNQFREAIAAWQTILRENPRDQEARKTLGDALVGGARQAAGQNRNGEAAELFARALTAVPGRRRELLREYADQVLYAGRPAEAVPLYREVLTFPGLSSGDLRQARLGLARGYAWSGQPALALPVFDLLVQAAPRDAEVLIGRGQALNALARHREALADFETAIAVQPSNRDAIRGAAQAEASLGRPRAALARVEPLIAAGDREPATLIIAGYARRAMGRPDLAEDIARLMLSAKPGDDGAERLLQELLRERRPLTFFDAVHAVRSDDLRISSLTVRHELTLNRGLSMIAPQARFSTYRGGDFPTVDIYSLGLAGRHRFNDWLEFTSSLFLNVEEEPRDQDLTLTHDTTLSLIPSDSMRIGFNLVRRYPDENSRAVVNDIFATDGGITLDYTPQNDFRISARGYASRYTDENERLWGQLEFAQRVTAGPYLWLGARYTAFDFKDVRDNGYWNPDDYRAIEASLHFYGQLAERWSFDIQAAAGYGRSNPGDGGLVGSATAKLSYEVGENLTIGLYASHLVSYARTGDNTRPGTVEDDEPFQRTAIGAEIRARW